MYHPPIHGRLRWAGFLLCIAAGCARVQPTPDDEVGGPEPVEPAMLKLTPDPVEVLAGARDVQVQLRAHSPTHGDVTDRALWSLSDPSLGSIGAGLLIVRGGLEAAGPAQVQARFGAQTGVAQLRVRIHAPPLLDPSAPAQVEDLFAGPEGGPAPRWVYPLAGALLGRNLGGMVLQFTGTAGAVAYRVRLEAPTYRRDLFLGPTLCPAERCQLRVPDGAWLAFARSAAGTRAVLTLFASTGAGQPVARAPDHELYFSPEDIEGGLFYWTSTTQRIFRVPMGSKFPLLYRSPDWTCAGCHTVSPDGRRVALQIGPLNAGINAVVDSIDPTQFVIRPGAGGSWFMQSYSPDGRMMAVAWQGKGRVLDAETGAKLYDIPEELVGGPLAFLEWSPDGRWLAFVRFPPGGGGTEPLYYDVGDIMIMPWNNGRFGPPQMIVPARPGHEYHMYPTWSPDSQWIAFSTGRVPCGGRYGGADGRCFVYGPAHTRLRLVRALPGQEPIELARATHQLGASTNWPRFAPFAHNGTRLAFLSFTAKFPYGFIKTDQTSQLWMAAVDLERARLGQDPSFPPVWLPFQRPYESNHMGSWTTGLGCNGQDDCPEDYACVARTCVRRIE
ncbi:MAG: hypothetical protein RMK29_03300 [Myxococcales bacterium]|nr:hypothetical protein [Myxococcota bacterium]MDW8280711.1 hypothetical protein [Myxococcales bacterium]